MHCLCIGSQMLGQLQTHGCHRLRTAASRQAHPALMHIHARYHQHTARGGFMQRAACAPRQHTSLRIHAHGGGLACCIGRRQHQSGTHSSGLHWRATRRHSTRRNKAMSVDQTSADPPATSPNVMASAPGITRPGYPRYRRAHRKDRHCDWWSAHPAQFRCRCPTTPTRAQQKAARGAWRTTAPHPSTTTRS